MAKNVDLLSYLPDRFHEIKEFIEIAKVENPILSELWSMLDEELDNLFIVSIDKSGAERYEQMLNLKSLASDTLESRRFRILTRYNEQAPYTKKVLNQLLDSLLGNGSYVLSVDHENKSLNVKIELTMVNMFNSVIDMLERITPQNMVITVELRYNTYQLLQGFSHSQLTKFTHKDLREDVIN